jgi:fructose-specific phosphotransferase system IIC component
VDFTIAHNLEENAMNTHVKVVGWLWIVNGLLSILMAVTGLAIINWPGVVSDSGDALLASSGVLCFFLPGIIAYIVVGYGVLKYKAWARILAIVLALLNLILFPIGTVIGIYTLWVMFNDEAEALFEAEG